MLRTCRCLTLYPDSSHSWAGSVTKFYYMYSQRFPFLVVFLCYCVVFRFYLELDSPANVAVQTVAAIASPMPTSHTIIGSPSREAIILRTSCTFPLLSTNFYGSAVVCVRAFPSGKFSHAMYLYMYNGHNFVTIVHNIIHYTNHCYCNIARSH